MISIIFRNYCSVLPRAFGRLHIISAGRANDCRVVQLQANYIQHSKTTTKLRCQKKENEKMSKFGKYLILATSFAILTTVADITGAVAKVHAHNHGCSVANLKGIYAFRRTGVNNVVGGPIAQIGIDVFNGDGTRGPIRSTRSTNGEIQDWTDFPPNGSYTVDSDCTGSFFDSDGTKTNNLVVLDGGKRFFLLSVAPDTITAEEGNRLGVED